MTRTDDTTYTEITIGEYGREGWVLGAGDLDWYCSSNTEAHHGVRPVYEENRAELVALMGPDEYGSRRDVSGFRVPARPGDASPRRSQGLGIKSPGETAYFAQKPPATMWACIWITCCSLPGRKAWRLRHGGSERSWV